MPGFNASQNRLPDLETARVRPRAPGCLTVVDSICCEKICNVYCERVSFPTFKNKVSLSCGICLPSILNKSVPFIMPILSSHWADFGAMVNWLEKCDATLVPRARIFNSLW